MNRFFISVCEKGFWASFKVENKLTLLVGHARQLLHSAADAIALAKDLQTFLYLLKRFIFAKLQNGST